MSITVYDLIALIAWDRVSAMDVFGAKGLGNPQVSETFLFLSG
ncbi:hypothetical protein [Microbacterium pygmaeum]|nr:hypothetical protein [Microbacterium pygmaeum]